MDCVFSLLTTGGRHVSLSSAHGDENDRSTDSSMVDARDGSCRGKLRSNLTPILLPEGSNRFVFAFIVFFLIIKWL